MQLMPPDWLEPVDPRPQARREWLAFAMTGVGMGVFAIYLFGFLVLSLMGDPNLRRWLDGPEWEWYVKFPTLISNLFAAFLFLGGSADSPRRSDVRWLILLTVASLGLWCSQHASLFGFAADLASESTDPVRSFLFRAFLFARIWIVAKLASSAISQSGERDTHALTSLITLTATLGFVGWLIFAINLVSWNQWPLKWGGFQSLEWFMIMLLSVLARATALFLTTGLCLAASATRSRDLARLHHEAKENDPFGPGSPWT